MILATLTIVLPMTNTVPSAALALLSVGLIQRDGVFVALGSAVAAAWAGLLVGVVTAFVLVAAWAVRLADRVGLSQLLERFTG